MFADRTPIGYLRTSGWSQGKFLVSRRAASGKIVSGVSTGAQIVESEKAVRTPLRSLSGSDLEGFLGRIRQEVAGGGR